MNYKNEFTIENFLTTDLDKVVDLFCLVWGGEKENIKSKTKWAFCSKRSKVLVMKNSENKIIAVRGGIIWPIQIAEDQIHAIQFHGTCVHPNYRRQGLFSQITKEYVNSCNSEGVSLIFNVSVKASRLGYEKLGWQYKKGFQRLTRFHIRNKNFKQNNDEFLVDSIPIEVLNNRFSQYKNSIHTQYDSEFLNWRLSNLNEIYKIFYKYDIYIVYKIKNSGSKRELIIGEVFSSRIKFSNFRKAFKLLFNKESPDISFTYLHKTHPFYNLYISCFFIPNFLNLNLNFGINSISNNYFDQKWCMSYLDIDTF